MLAPPITVKAGRARSKKPMDAKVGKILAKSFS
jgi:hypothetical protein